MSPLHVVHSRHQKGASLLVVLVIMLLSSLLVLGGSRVTHLNEVLAGSDTDYQRAFEAAQMLLRDAELDIQDTADNLRSDNLSLSKVDNELLLNLMDAALQAGTVKCANAVCVNQGSATSGNPATSFWNNPTSLANFQAVGATYGQWTGANPGAATTTANPIISADPARAWYWIEILPYSGLAPGWAQDCAPTKGAGKYFFRITAVALGRSNVPAVVQEVFVPKPEGDQRRCPV